jgi:hypothetical protein
MSDNNQIPIPTPTPRPTSEATPQMQLDLNYVNIALANEAIQAWHILPGNEIQATTLVITFFFGLSIIIVQFRKTFGGKDS